jgi:cation diffusion facilitator CzcD-associated flavoprotein CzcO
VAWCTTARNTRWTCLIYATGFQWMATASFNMITGRDGRTLREKWQTDGVKTFLGIHSHGFPNLLIMSGPQGGGGQFNFIRGLESHTDYVVWMLSTLRERGARVVDIRKEAGGGLRRALRARPTFVPGPCAIACRTTTVTATRNRAASPTTAVPRNGMNCARPPRHR